MRAADLVEGDILAHVAVQPEDHATGLELLVAAHDHGLFQLEAGNAIGHQPAGPVVAVIDRDLHAVAAQHVRRGKTAGAGADDADAFAALHMRADRLDPALVPGGVGDELLDRTDGDRAVAGLLDHAVALAQAVLRADAATDLGKGIGGLADLVGLAQPALGGQAQPVGNIVVQRAMRLAIRHAALRTAAGLFLGLGTGVVRVDFLKIPVANARIPLVGHGPTDLHEFQHRLLCHQPLPFRTGSLLYSRANRKKSNKC